MKLWLRFSFTTNSVCILALVFTFLSFTGFFMPASILAENITYDGTQLQTDPIENTHSSLYPTGGSSLSGNIIIVNSGTIPGSVYGGIAITGGVVTTNTVTLNGGTVAYNVYGGYSNISIISADDNKEYTSGVSNTSANANAVANYANVAAGSNVIFLGDSLIISGDLYGGYATLSLQAGKAVGGTATGNTLSYASASAYADADATNIYADNNYVALGEGTIISGNLSGGYAALSVNGGSSTSGAATSNLSSGTAYANTNAYAYADNTSVGANDNSVILDASITVLGNFHGGYAVLSANSGTAISGKAKVNNVSSSGLANATAYATADQADVSADNNSVRSGDNLSISGDFYGGYAVLNLHTDTATGGTAEASSTSSSANAFAVAYATADQTSVSADNNSVYFGDSVSISGDLYGGYASLNLQTGTVTGGTSTGNTSGTVNAYTNANASAKDTSVSANNNSITLNNGNVGGSFYGGYSVLKLQTGIVEGGTATNNTASSGYAYAYANANVYAQDSKVSADNNSVTFGGSVAIYSSLYGGYAALDLQAGTATGGKVINSTSSLATANANANANASSASVSANNNSVTLGNGGIVSGDLHGGYAALSANGGTVTPGTVNGSYSSAVAEADVRNTTVSANDNRVTINGGTIAGNLYGGYVLFEVTTNDTVALSGSSVTAINNIVTIGVDTVLNAAKNLYGGYLKYNIADNYLPQNLDMFSGNTLNITGKHTLDGVYNFEYLGFTLPTGFSAGDSLITANTVNLDEYASGSGSTVTGIDSLGVLNVGQTYALITASGGFSGSIANTETRGVYNTAFFSGTYEWEALGVTNNVLTATLKSMSAPDVKPKTNAVGEGFAAGLAFLGQAADLRSGLELAAGSGFAPFVSMTYGSHYISTGSSINVKGFSALAGVTLSNDLSNGDRLTMGLFLEGGWGDYNSHNNFSNFSAVKGKGDTEYYGGGLMTSYVTSGGLYGEAFFAVGKTKTDFRSWDFTPGIRAKYNFNVPYYSTNLTAGQVLRLTDLLDLDIYGKYLWTRQEGDSVMILDHRFKFKDADSHRVRAGGKLTADVLPQLQPYVGAAYEYEFSGRIKGSLYGINLDKPSLRGGTGIGELGLVWSPTDSGNFKVDLGAQGYGGKREGVSGGLTVTMSF